MPNLYNELGIPKDATQADIRSAYRRRAKKAHPDTEGGDEKKFAAVALAHRVLIDPDLRARYDETGEYDENPPVDQAEERANGLLAAALCRLLQDDRINPASTDLVRALREVLSVDRKKHAGTLDLLARGRARAEKIKGRFRKKSSEGSNRLEQMVDWQLRQIDSSERSVQQTIADHERALEILLDYSFKADEAPNSHFFASGFHLGPSTSSTTGY